MVGRERLTLLGDDGRPIPAGLLEKVAASAAGDGALHGLAAEVVQLRARERSLVLEYRLKGGLRLIAKRYARSEDALACYEILRVLWAHGFGPGSPHRVPEPLGCFADHRVLLMGVAPGQRLATLAADPGPWRDGLAAAARWLAQFHALSAGLAEPREDIAQGVFRLARRAARAAARHPELEGVIVQLIEELAARARSLGEPSRQVQTHGRYHSGHVFVTPDSAAVIDLDRVALADPAKDVGEFLHRLRSQSRNHRLSHDDVARARLVFLGEYAAHALGIPRGLTYFWSYSILSSLLRLVELDQARVAKGVESYRADFEEVPARVDTLGQLLR